MIEVKKTSFPRLAGALLAASMLPAPAAAQEIGPVTLVFDNGLDGENISGELREFDGERFLLAASIGLLAIPAEDVSCIGAVCPEGTELEIDSPVLVLTSLDGQSSVRGELLDVSDGAYVLATDVGQVTIQADLVTCEGTACIEAEPFGGPAVFSFKDIEIEGDLLAIEEGAYVVEVAGFGEIRVPTADYTCTGPGCP